MKRIAHPHNPMIFAMIEAGGGHKSPAMAVAEAFMSQHPQALPPKVVDFCIEVGAVRFDAEHKAQWDALLKRPYLTSFGYEMQDRFNTISRWYLRTWTKDFFRKTETWMRANRPSLFFATHWLNAAAAAHARNRIKDLHCPIVYFLTEAFDASSLHSWQGIDLYLVSSKEAADCLVRRGVRPDRIEVTGYPVRPSFFNITRDRLTVLDELACNPALPTLLVSSGAQGIGRIERIAHRLASHHYAMNIIVVCGRNEELHQSLVSQRRPANGQVGAFVPLGFREDMNELLQAVDIVSIKAGPASTFEALYLGKPIIFLDYIARFERMNAQFVTNHGIGWMCHSTDALISRLSRLSQHPEEIALAQTMIKTLSLHNGADRIAAIIAKKLNGRS